MRRPGDRRPVTITLSVELAAIAAELLRWAANAIADHPDTGAGTVAQIGYAHTAREGIEVAHLLADAVTALDEVERAARIEGEKAERAQARRAARDARVGQPSFGDTPPSGEPVENTAPL